MYTDLNLIQTLLVKPLWSSCRNDLC